MHKYYFGKFKSLSRMAKAAVHTGGNEKGSKHVDNIKKASVVASRDAGMSYEDIRRKKWCAEKNFSEVGGEVSSRKYRRAVGRLWQKA